MVRTHRSLHKDANSSLDAFSVHDYASIAASGSRKPFIELFSFPDTNRQADGTVNSQFTTLDTIRYHIGFLGQRIGPVTTLSFHKHKLLLASGSADSYISIFAGEKLY